MTTTTGTQVEARMAPPATVEIAYTPGEWFDATTVDLMEAFYRSRLPAIREAARVHGYAIGVHGSMRRDLDLIAAPWRDGASDADRLAGAIQRAACGFENEKFQWEKKPAGRVAVSMPICWTHRHGVLSDGHIDLSVCPPIAQRAGGVGALEGWGQEADDLDAVLRLIGLDPDTCRTDGGSLNMSRVRDGLDKAGIVAKESRDGIS